MSCYTAYTLTVYDRDYRKHKDLVLDEITGKYGAHALSVFCVFCVRVLRQQKPGSVYLFYDSGLMLPRYRVWFPFVWQAAKQPGTRPRWRRSEERGWHVVLDTSIQFAV